MINGKSHKLYHMIEMRTTIVAREESKEGVRGSLMLRIPGVTVIIWHWGQTAPLLDVWSVTPEQKLEGGEGLSRGEGVL